MRIYLCHIIFEKIVFEKRNVAGISPEINSKSATVDDRNNFIMNSPQKKDFGYFEFLNPNGDSIKKSSLSNLLRKYGRYFSITRNAYPKFIAFGLNSLIFLAETVRIIWFFLRR